MRDNMNNKGGFENEDIRPIDVNQFLVPLLIWAAGCGAAVAIELLSVLFNRKKDHTGSNKLF